VAREDSRSDLATTIEARVAELLGDTTGAAVARTLVEHPGTTIQPRTYASEGGLAAVDALRSIGASLHGKIQIHKTLGEGGMGVVHLATQATVGRHVAVKTLRAGVTSSDATVRILREAWVTGALEHPNIVPIYDVGVDASGSPLIVMKRIEGQNWAELVQAHGEIAARFPKADPHEWNLDILTSVCNAVHFAHSRGILHRDLKPENVMIGAFGEVYVLDWGIAVSLREDPTGRLPPASSAKEVAGTPHYMAPEMLLGDPTKLSARSDVYLLGAILYEIFTGSPPHTGDDLNALVTHILVSPIHFPDSVPEEVRDICEKAMRRDPADRYESAESFRLAIDEYLRHRGSRKLASEAKDSHALLTVALTGEPGEATTRRVANLLGECRFGYRAALTAWPENAEAREGLDRALISVIEAALVQGDTSVGETLLREVTLKPAELARRVDAAVKSRAEHDDKLQKLEADLDATTGMRTRMFLGIVFGSIWTTAPLLLWCMSDRVAVSPYAVAIVTPLVFLLIGHLAFVWARDTLMKTALNRRLMRTGGVFLIGQCLLAVGGWGASLPLHALYLVTMFTWALTFGLLSIWAEAWFAILAVTCTVTFLVATWLPSLLYPFMSLDNLVFTVVLVRFWYPKGELERLRTRKRELIERHRAWHARKS
jgi:eukaryotic-like serine/threonine-protein kinase